MLFHVTWDFTDTSDEAQRQGQAMLGKWQPPSIVEVDSAATLARTIAPWTSSLSFTVTPILPIEESSAINAEAFAFRDSLS
jgi:hypothetical protein